jgi:hypothetical protein
MTNSISRFAAAFGVAALAVLASSPASATLHGFCTPISAPNCADNGTITPIDSNPPAFGFRNSPTDAGSTTTFLLEVLIPNNVLNANSLSFSIDGTHTGNATAASTLTSLTAWTSGFLDSYLGISAQPSNPIGGYLPSTQTFQASATGYFDYQFNFGAVTFSALTDPQFTTTFGLPTGAIILAFYDDGTQSCTHGRHPICTEDWTATANSGALIEVNDFVPCADCGPQNTPEPMTLSLFGAGLAGAAAFVRRRKSAKKA